MVGSKGEAPSMTAKELGKENLQGNLHPAA